jgi:phospholipid-binding lipoprotein MlaA
MVWLAIGLAPVAGVFADEPGPPAVSTPAEATEDDADFAAFAEVTGAQEKVSDPLILYNRAMFRVNDAVYMWVLRPLSHGYAAVVPQRARVSVGQFFQNLRFPERCVNNLLQAKPRRAGTECLRFGVNATVGVLGFFDPATSWLKLAEYPEDFGQTLGFWGVPAGVPVTLPLLGPSNLRDTVGLVPDHFLDPVNYVDSTSTRLAARGTEHTNRGSLHLGEYERFTRGALDPYIMMRSAYRQNRDASVRE